MFKPGVIIRNTRILMMIASLGISGWANATEIQWTATQDKAGLTVVTPSISIDGLINDVVMLKTALKHDEEILSQRVEQGRITKGESLMSLLLPGGMLYAAYKKSNHVRAVSAHKQVLAQFNDLTEDLNVLMTNTLPILVAKR